MPIRNRQAERREATRQEILTAAWSLAHASGLGALTLGDIGRLVGMKAPSLYTHFDSKAAIYDAMFGQAWAACRDAMAAAIERAPGASRERLTHLTQAFMDFCLADPDRHQLMNTRAIPGFIPSAEAYRPAVETLSSAREQFRLIGVVRDSDVDLLTAIIGGLIEAQLANDAGGTRWSRLLGGAIDMFADSVGLPARPPEGPHEHDHA